MGKMIFWENGKYIVRNYATRIMLDPDGKQNNFDKPGELSIYCQVGKGDDRKGILEVLAPDREERNKKSPSRGWFKNPHVAEAVLIAFALGAWSMWTAVTLAVLSH